MEKNKKDLRIGELVTTKAGAWFVYHGESRARKGYSVVADRSHKKIERKTSGLSMLHP